MRIIPSMKVFFPQEDVEQVKDDVEKILKSGMLTLGEYTKRFEAEYTKVCGVEHSVAVSSGTSALEIVLRAFDLRSGEEVIVPTNTFSATAAGVFFAGGKPVLTDIDRESLCVNAENVQKYMTSKTRGVIVVHIGGLICPDIRAIRELCKDYRLFLVEDAAHAHGSLMNGHAAGSLGDAGCFSFYPTKVVTTGEGGMITTNVDEIAEKARILRDQGKKNFHSNVIVELGYNWRMNEISAAIGLTQLKRLSEVVRKRNMIAKYYDEQLSRLDGVEPLKTPPDMVNCYYKYVVLLDPEFDRGKLKRKLDEKGVRCGGEVYWPPLHLQPVYQRLLGTKEGDFPVAGDVCRRMVCLPIYTQMTLDEAGYVVDKLAEVLSEI